MEFFNDMLHLFLDPKLIFLNQSFPDKKSALQYFCQKLAEEKLVSDPEKALALFWEREMQSSTGVGDQIAMPHIRDDVALKDVIFVAKVADLDWEAVDQKPVKYIFGISMTKTGGADSYLAAIAQLSSLLINQQFVAEFENANSANAIIDVFKKYQSTISASQDDVAQYDYLAVTACPTGIAHTYMAAEMLKKAAKEMGIKLKVETQGTQGIENGISTADLQNAKGLILALDRAVDTARFANMNNVIETTTKEAIANPNQLIKKIVAQKGKRLTAVVNSSSTSFETTNPYTFEGFLKKSYRSILTGVSYMLPFVIFGGIMIALAFLIDLIGISSQLGLDALKKSEIGQNFGSYYSTAAWFKTIGGKAFDLLVPILSAYITFAIVGKVGLLPGFIVGFMASGLAGQLLPFINLNNLKDVNSGFFGAIGGAFLTAAIIICIYKYIGPKVSKNLRGIFNILVVPLFGTLVIVVLFWFLNIPLQYLNELFAKFLGLFKQGSSYATYLLWLLGLIIGLMMASDLGGPINKAAYVFGTVSLSENLQASSPQPSVPMALAIVAGMIPPLGIALSTVVSKKYWSVEERQSAKSNWILGLSFISEGAIPFTAARPKVLVPANLIGASVGGLVAGALGLASWAPHGGIFILPLFNSIYFNNIAVSLGMGILFFVFALVAGTVAQAASLHFLLKYDASKRLRNQ